LALRRPSKTTSSASRAEVRSRCRWATIFSPTSAFAPANSVAQILLLDKTSLTIGPRAELTLDKFVYNPTNGGAGQVVLNAVQGAFRFVSGSQNPRSYTVRTPVGTLGVRGTIVDLIVQKSQTIVVLVEGALTFTINSQTYTLSKPGQAYIFGAGAGGKVQGPVTWDGTILNTSASISFPLYGWHFQGELGPSQQDINIGNIDQLNGVIQRGLTPPPPRGNSYGGGCCQ
jgi:hypothetical protein